MVRRSPEGGDTVLVRKRDGRQVPFDAGRLTASLQRALLVSGRVEPTLAGDLRGVIETYLAEHAGTGRDGRPGMVSADAIAELAQDVLRGAGCEPAAEAYRAAREERARARGQLRIRATAAHDPVRAIPPASRERGTPREGGSGLPRDLTGRAGDSDGADPGAWSKGRVAALLSHVTDLPAGSVDAIASEVERGLFASGLRSIGAALLREWIDNELVLRGHPPRLGQHRFVGLAPHELRGILAEGAAGLSAETEVSRRLFTRYALSEVYPADVRDAHEQGLIGLENLGAGGRLDSVTLAPWGLPVFAALAGQRERLRALGPLLRTLAHLHSREVLLDWDGPALASQPLSDLLLHLAEVAPLHAGGARLVICVSPERAGCAAAFLGALETLRRGPAPRPALLPCVRLPAPALSPALLAEAVAAEAVDDRVQFAAGAARPGLVGASVAVNLVRLALASGPRRR
ncbi:MAG TPA: ATP cone domain-containing protein, partial [Planctomycetota bacterium]|nr:ATP cone domain-containing protein [Planctomycetota bacterium]